VIDAQVAGHSSQPGKGLDLGWWRMGQDPYKGLLYRVLGIHARPQPSQTMIEDRFAVSTVELGTTSPVTLRAQRRSGATPIRLLTAWCTRR
jgi:hypothetical protein